MHDTIKTAMMAQPDLTSYLEAAAEIFSEEELEEIGTEGLIDWAENERDRDRAEAEAEAQAEAQAEAEYAAWLAVERALDNAQARLENMIASEEPRWQIAGCHYSRSSQSRYLRLEWLDSEYGTSLEVRLSDHAQPEYGGWCEDRQERLGESDVSFVIETGDEDLTPVRTAMRAAEKSEEK